MKRFVEDFDQEVHAINEDVDEPGRHAEVQVQEFDDDIMEVRKRKPADVLTASQKFERKYEQHEQSQKRNNINLSVLMLPIVLAIYLSFNLADLDMQMRSQAKIDVLGSVITVALCVFGLGVLTYFDDLILCF